MADKIKAIRAYTPSIKQQGIASNHNIADLIAGRTTFTYGAVGHMLREFFEALFFYARDGYGVRLDGVGLFSPTIKKDGTITLNYRIDKALKSNLNKESEGYRGGIINKEMIGASLDEIIERWNKEHPDDPVVREEK